MSDLETVVKELLQTPYAKTYKDEYVYVRCPLCGDSVKHKTRPTCSIWIKPGQPLIYHCWICEESGIVSHSFLRDLNIYKTDVFSAAARYNKTTFREKTNVSKFVLPSKAKDLVVPKIRDTEMNRFKLKYISARLGIPFTYEALEYLRVIPSIKDFLKLNYLSPNPDWVRSINKLDLYYVGFLTSDKTNIVFRDVTDTRKIKYLKYPIFHGIDLGEMFYSIPMQIDVMSPEINMHVAEGIFDILGVFFHVMRADTKNNFYIAVCGSGYKRVLRYFLRKGFLTNLNVNIYSDSDKSFNWYNNLSDLRLWCNETNLFYNAMEDEKDFGVPKNKILIKKAVFR